MTIVEFLTARLNEEGAAWGGGVQLFTQPSFAKLSRYMLADIAAKRAIIHQHGDEPHECPEGFMDSAETEPHIGYERECPTLRHLASVYAAHEDYQQEWKP